MSRHARPADVDAVDQAIARVLAVEEAAQRSVAGAAIDGADAREAAREAARAIAQRTERRVRGVRARYEAKISARVAALDAQAPTPPKHVLDAEETAWLERAVEAVVAQLTGPASR